MPHCNKRMLSFFLTTKCNLCCRYCYNAKERNSIEEQTIPLHVAFSAVDWYFATNDSRHIRFYGPGEPTQAFETMKQITEYAKAHSNGGERVTVEIQTNGIFSDEVRKWILENVNIVWMSFDGMKDIQNYNRPINPQYREMFAGKTSAEVLEENVKWLIENKDERDLMVGARVTMTDNNVSKQREMVDYFYSLGIRYVWTNPLFYSVGKIPVNQDEEKRQIYHFDIDAYVDNYIDAYYYAKNKGLFWGSFLIINFDGESEYHCRCCTPQCAPHITPDGYVSACDLVLLGNRAYHMDMFVVGKWNEHIQSFVWDNEKIDRLNNRKSTNMEHCSDCPAKLHCGGYCLGECVNETGEIDGEIKNRCRAIQKLYRTIGEIEPYKYLHP